MAFKIVWFDHHREPQCPPDPAFPNGKHMQILTPVNATPSVRVDSPTGVVSASGWCGTELPYPAARCGVYLVECQTCGFRCAVTTAGRRDDPCSISFPCHKGTTLQ
jgi:hypothetical protein